MMGLLLQRGVLSELKMIAQDYWKDVGAYCVLNGTNITEDIKETKYNDICSGGRPNMAYKKWGMVCLVSTIYSITDWAFFIILAGFFYLTAFGDPAKISQASHTIVYAIIGLVIALVSRIVPSIVLMVVK
ncbi:MAG: hypothetical protein NTV62_00685 [Candidatus Gribaldobacteria bacterium]|nr:hypothetical protein [Candidatus Gribaldobacteria bacterium]